MKKFIVSLAFVLLAQIASAAVIDAPHNAITCSTCHSYSLWWQYSPTSQNPPPDDHPAIVDAVCLTCHKDGAGGLPKALTHSSAVINSGLHETWGVGCTACHNPHSQEQLTWVGTTTEPYLITGTISGISYNSSLDQSTITYSAATGNQNWPAEGALSSDPDWGNKSLANPNRGLILIHDKLNALNTFSIVSATSSQIIIKGELSANAIDPGYINQQTQVQNSASCNTFGLIYGQLIKASIAAKPVKFFDPTDGFTEGTATPTGVCQVCHTATSYWRADGSLPTHHNGEQCTSCHAHDHGFAGFPNNGKHSIHLTTDEIPCSRCHTLSALRDGAGNILFKDGQTLDSTTVCGECHQDGMAGAPAQTGYKEGWLDTGYHPGCSGCHGFPPAYSNGSPKTNSHQGHSAVTCDKCHAATTTTGSTITNTTNHANDAADLLAGTGTHFTYTSDPTGGSCATVSCHGDTDAQWGTANCLGCHSVAQGTRPPISSQFSANSHHIQGATVTNEHCYQCHWEAKADGTINQTYHGGTATPGSSVDLVVYGAGTRPTSYDVASTAIQYTANGNHSEIAKLNAHCLGCHSDGNNTTQPFGDGKTPKNYAWDDNSVDARYSQTGTTAWGKYSGVGVTPKDVRNKAYSAHGNAVANEGGWDLSESWPNTRGGSVNVACYDCHNSHGSSISGATTSYASATANGGILKDTTLGGDGYAVSYKPVAGGSTEDKDFRTAGASLCFDCHLTADGATESMPWGYQSTYGSLQPIAGYLDTPFFGPGTFGFQGRYSYKRTAHKGGHFGASSSLSPSPSKSIAGLCSSCHDPHGVSSTLGTNQQYGVPLLKGTYLTSPYREDAAPANNTIQTGVSQQQEYHIDQNTFGPSPSIYSSASGGITQTDEQFAGLCLTCHPKSSLTDGSPGGTWKSKDRVHESVKGWGANAKHQYVCSKCHASHNSNLPRLMVTNCLNSSHKGRAPNMPAPVTLGNSSGSSDCGSGSGSGRIPGSYSGHGFPCDYGPNGPNPGDNPLACHENQTGSGTDQSWNSVTPWAIDIPVISSGPVAGSFSATGSNVQATITWTTNSSYSSSFVDFGPTISYGTTQGSSPLVMSHSVVLQDLANHSTYHYRVRSTSGPGHETASGDATFSISLPPTVPSLTPVPSTTCASNCPVTLQFASTDPDNGPLQYYVEVGDVSNMSSPNYNSGWISAPSWSPTLPTNKTWYWRVKARDANHTLSQDPVSAWSAVSSTSLTEDIVPQQVVLTSPGDSTAVLSDVTLQWTAVPGAFIEYMVQYSSDATFTTGVVPSGWTTYPAWQPTFGPGTYWWRVQARNSITLATGTWSSSRSFSVTDECYGDSCCLYGCSSCPTVYAWDGEKFTVETETFPTGFLGTKTPAGFRKPNPFEYHLLESTPQLLDGYYNLKVVEEKDETDYLDTLKLYAVDYPEDRDIYQELRTGTYVPPAQMIHTVGKTLQRPVSIKHVNTDEDVSAKLASSDKDYLILNTDRNIDFNWHTLEIDLGEQSAAAQIKLVIDAEMVAPTTSAGMAHKTELAPNGKITKLEVLDANGNWVLVDYAVKEVSSPKERGNAYLVDITNIFTTTPTYKFRLSFLYKVYVDAIFLDTTLDVPVTVTELPMVSATLSYYGFSQKTDGELFEYIYGNKVSSNTSYFSGNYTAYGVVTPLLTETDDKFAIFAGGDELDVRFTADSPPAGQSRRYLLYANGYYKATGNIDIPHTVAPLPFATMSNYPYPAGENYPSDAGHDEYLLNYNTRTH